MSKEVIIHIFLLNVLLHVLLNFLKLFATDFSFSLPKVSDGI